MWMVPMLSGNKHFLLLQNSSFYSFIMFSCTRPCKARKPRNATLAASSLNTLAGLRLPVFVVVCKTRLCSRVTVCHPRCCTHPTHRDTTFCQPTCASPQMQWLDLLYLQRLCNTPRQTQVRVASVTRSVAMRYEKVLALFGLTTLTTVQEDLKRRPLSMTPWPNVTNS